MQTTLDGRRWRRAGFPRIAAGRELIAMDRVGCGSAAVGFTLRREMYIGIVTRA
jgi:hypothetical protein